MIEIIVKSVPKLVTLHSRQQTEGSYFDIYCSIQEGSLPVFFEWTKNGHKLKSTSDTNYKIEISQRLSTLTIESITRSDAANYTCGVNNAYGSDYQSMVLSIKGIL